MGYNNDGTDDLEKLRIALRQIATQFGSLEDILNAFGLSQLPTAQRYGILFGCLVFIGTVLAVIALLILGGTFQRIAAQEAAGADGTADSMVTSHDARAARALLMEKLLESRERMVQENYPPPVTTTEPTNLTKMLLNQVVVVPALKNSSSSSSNHNLTHGGENEENKNQQNSSKKINDKKKQQQKPSEKAEATANNDDQNDIDSYNNELYTLYKDNYTEAYRHCQDRMGGAVLSGRPEARFEAYARAYAGCGPYCATWYRRSYGRLYEATVCQNHATDDKYTTLYNARPTDIIGRHVRLEALLQRDDEHVQDLFNITSGDAVYDCHAYDPNQIWSFMEDGPFVDAASLGRSFVFCHKLDEAAFAVRHNVTDRLLGAVLLTHDDPLNLTCQLEPPIMHPQHEDHGRGTLEQLECCFLLLDRLFAHGYRRIQIAIDAQDAHKRKWAVRLGFTLEGCLFKHMVVKESSRDSNIYGLANNDWKRNGGTGARSALFAQLYGKTALRADLVNEQKNEEWEEQQRFLNEKKRLEKEAAVATTTTATDATTTNKDKKV